MISFSTMFNANSPTPNGVSPQCNTAVREDSPVTRVGENAQDQDEDLERHINECGQEMELAMRRWEEGGNFADRGDADYWFRAMKCAISQRRPEYVAKLERERGLL